MVAPIIYGIGVGVVALWTAYMSEGCDGGPEPASTPLDDDGNDPCGECHTSPRNFPPSIFQMFGENVRGAHLFHFSPRFAKPLFCDACHPMPNVSQQDAVWHTPTHINKSVDVDFHGLAQRLVSKAFQFDAPMAGCRVYCHGNAQMSWRVENEQPTLDCFTCHKPTTPPHDTNVLTECSRCHDQTMNPDGSIKSRDLHLNGTADVVENLCSACHGYPPDSHEKIAFGCPSCHPTPVSPFRTSETDTHKNGAVSFQENLCASCHEYPPTSGAHPTHLAPTLTAPIPCETCHTVPLVADGLLAHTNKNAWPPVNFPGLVTPPGLGDLQPVYDATAKQCANIYCHGAGLPEGQVTNPLAWTDTSGAPKACGGCHGIPPPSPHLSFKGADMCPLCHTAPQPHVNGQIDF